MKKIRFELQKHNLRDNRQGESVWGVVVVCVCLIPVIMLTAESIPQAPCTSGFFPPTHRYVLTEAFCRARPPSLWSNPEGTGSQRKGQGGAMSGKLRAIPGSVTVEMTYY